MRRRTRRVWLGRCDCWGGGLGSFISPLDVNIHPGTLPRQPPPVLVISASSSHACQQSRAGDIVWPVWRTSIKLGDYWWWRSRSNSQRDKKLTENISHRTITICYDGSIFTSCCSRKTRHFRVFNYVYGYLFLSKINRPTP